MGQQSDLYIPSNHGFLMIWIAIVAERTSLRHKAVWRPECPTMQMNTAQIYTFKASAIPFTTLNILHMHQI